MNYPLPISVVIPSYNRADLLEDALKGLSEQTLSKNQFEVIVVDNCSTDSTKKFLKKIAPELPFELRVFQTVVNLGPAPARNLGAKKAEGKIIAFLDNDCRPSPGWLSNALKAFQENDIAMATGVIDFKPEQISRHNLFSRKSVVCNYEHPTYPTANSFYRYEVFHQLKGFNEKLSFPSIFGQAVEAADTDLAWRLKGSGYKNIFLKDAVVYHEVQVLKPIDWLLEPLRLFLLPALIKMHPGLRPKILFKGIFFVKNIIYYYLLLIIALLFILFWFKGILMFPIALLLLSAVKEKSLNPVKVCIRSATIILNSMKNYVLLAALIYGSIRFKSLVL